MTWLEIELSSGRRPVSESILQLRDPEIKSWLVAKLYAALAASWNELLQTRRVRKLRGYPDLFELRVPARNVAYRLLFTTSGPASLHSTSFRRSLRRHRRMTWC